MIFMGAILNIPTRQNNFWTILLLGNFLTAFGLVFVGVAAYRKRFLPKLNNIRHGESIYMGKKPTRWLGVLSLAGSLTAVPLMIAFALTGWGEPGTAAYQTYELLNRLIAWTLLLMAAGWLGLALSSPSGYGRWGAWLALSAALVMVTGNAAEFYLFSDQPYGDIRNLRTISWTAFSLGSLVLDIGATIVGVAIYRRQLWPRWIGMLLMMSLPLDILAFFIFSPFLGPAVLALVVGSLLVRSTGSFEVQAGTVM